MMNQGNRIIFHIDVNNAFLSWEAVDRLKRGEELDLRTVPSVIGGDEESRHGIVLAKSMQAKKFNVTTGEPLYSARRKCNNLVVVPPRHHVYAKASKELMNMLKQYTPVFQQYSIDECFLDFTNMERIYPDILKLAYDIKDKVYSQFGFTVNVGIADNKLLAKMASDFTKPNKVHTLFSKEVKEKMWPLPIERLFMVGKATLLKFSKLNIHTIEDLANYDADILEEKFHKYGIMIRQYANGIDDSPVVEEKPEDLKSISNSTTTSIDITNYNDGRLVIMSLAETVAARLRESKYCCRLVAVTIKDSNFKKSSKQLKFLNPTDSTNDIIDISCRLLKELWNGKPIRLLEVRVGSLCFERFNQLSLLENNKVDEKNKNIDSAIDKIRKKFGNKSIFRAGFINTDISPMAGKDEQENKS
ncbi:DNA polymerase Y family protein [Clostridium oryzae]|uniref:DNA polymerase IV n=1 Tax=Clostridium oryzae TaxID=1450648 RepID=A0A1V4IKQ3_9CLOT|nr:DNA polymerase IV [Clostridium oryzae]OPJ60315.1 DNA polymerase IV [Clostridium oryzae]